MVSFSFSYDLCSSRSDLEPDIFLNLTFSPHLPSASGFPSLYNLRFWHEQYIGEFFWVSIFNVINESMFCLLDHCMVNFIKENLLGSIKEFRNRFINPIQNGQCADSTMVDVRVMKKRAHILYEMLAGCVQVQMLP